MGVVFLLYFILQLPWLLRAASSDCQEYCGAVGIRFPFGIKTGCYHSYWFRVTCNETANGLKPFISCINLELLGLSSPGDNIVIINNPVTYLNCGHKGSSDASSSPSNVDLQGSPFFFSSRFNVFGSAGCGNLATVFHSNETTPIASCLQKSCGDLSANLASCYVTISESFTSYNASMTEVVNAGSRGCTSAFLFNKQDSSSTSYPESNDQLLPPDPGLEFLYGISINTTHVPAALEWNPCDLEVALCDKIFTGVANRYIRQDGCAASCGNVDIPYPFGIEIGCYMNDWFRVTCNETTDGPKIYLTSIGMQLLNVSVLEGTVVVNSSITYSNCLKTDGVSVNLTGTPFSFSAFYNRFMSVGCGSLATILRSPTDEYPVRACMQPICGNWTSDAGCNADFPWDLSSFAVNMKEIHPLNNNAKSCTSAFIVDKGYLEKIQHRKVASNWMMTHVPVTLKWSTQIRGLCNCGSGPGDTYSTLNLEYYWSNLSESYLCVCARNANGHISTDVCQGCSTSLGTLIALIGTWHSLKVLERRKSIKLKQKYFKRNGGLLLQQQLSSNEGNVERVKLFTSKELEKATDYFNENRILGHGGQGTVYKGMLTDGSIVAIKKSNMMNEKKSDETKLKQFINEVMLLSQINHRNVVKLLGCCLETKVPLLVYEFITNGTLSHLLHEPNEDFPLTWEKRQSEEEVRSLVNIFLLSMKGHSLLEIVDPMVMNGGPETEIVAVAKLAKRCLNLNGKKRPTMKEVAMELEQIRSSEGANGIEQNTDEDSDIDDMNEPSGTASCSLSSSIVNDSVTLSLDA
ncbi:hypothetical protein V6N13_047243 [Hibiscus sabdariffa]